MGGLSRGRETPLRTAAFSRNAFSAPHTQPLSGPPLPRRQRREQLFPPSRGPRWKRHPWARRQAGDSRPCEPEVIRDQRRGANIKLRPLLPFSLLYAEYIMQELSARCLGWEDPLEKGMAPHSSILA